MQPISTMSKLSTFLFFYFFSSVIFGQPFKAIQLADSLLKTGNFKAVITTYDFPKDIKELQDKALKNLKSNRCFYRLIYKRNYFISNVF